MLGIIAKSVFFELRKLNLYMLYKNLLYRQFVQDNSKTKKHTQVGLTSQYLVEARLHSM